MNGFQSIGEAIAAVVAAVFSDDGVRAVLWLLGFVFLWSGTAKLRAPERAAWALVDFGVARRVQVGRGVAFAGVEVATGAALCAGAVLGGVTAVVAASVSAGLLAAFVALIARGLSRGAQFECFCFGEGSGTLSARTLGRAGALLALAVIAVSQAGAVTAAPAADAALLPAVIAASAMSIGMLIFSVPNLLSWNARAFALDESHYVQRLEP